MAKVRNFSRNFEEELRFFERGFLPWLGDVHTNDIESAHVLLMAKRIEPRGNPDTVKRAIQVCEQVFQYGIILAKESKPIRDVTKAIKANFLSALKHWA